MTEAFEFHVPATCANLGPGFGVLAIALDLPLVISVEPREEEGHAVERRGESDAYDQRELDRDGGSASEPR